MEAIINDKLFDECGWVGQAEICYAKSVASFLRRRSWLVKGKVKDVLKRRKMTKYNRQKLDREGRKRVKIPKSANLRCRKCHDCNVNADEVQWVDLTRYEDKQQ